MSTNVLTRRTDEEGRVTLTKEFANCVVTIEFHGEEIRIRKSKATRAHKYSFKELMVRVSPENIHGDVKTGPPVGREAL